MNKVISVVIVRNSYGYTAYVRFSDSSRDINMHCHSKFRLYGLIEGAVRRAKAS